MLAAGAAMYQAINIGANPLHIASRQGYAGVVHALSAAGAAMDQAERQAKFDLASQQAEPRLLMFKRF